MRKVVINNSKVLRLMQKKQKLYEEGNAILEQMTKLEKEHKSAIQRMAKLNDKVQPLIVKELKNVEFDTYETLGGAKLEDGKVIAEITDQLEEYKAFLDQKKKEAENKNIKSSS